MKFRIGIYEKALPLEIHWFSRLKAAQLAGFDFVEMSIDPSEERLGRLDWGKSQRKKVKQAIVDVGLPILSICLSAKGQRINKCYIFKYLLVFMPMR